MTTSNENLQRADIALGQLASNGGLLNPEQTNTFIDLVMEQPTILNEIRQVRMGAPSMKINKIGLGGRVLRAATQAGGAEDDGTNGRYLKKAGRTAPITSQIQMDTKEVIAEVRIPYEVLEDNIEGDKLEEHILRLIAAQVSLDLEELLLFGDTANADPYLALFDGFLKRSSLHIVDNANSGANDALITNALLSMPQKYLRNLPQMRGYMSIANRIKFQQSRIVRQTAMGDQSVTNAPDVPLYSGGLQIRPVNTLAVDNLGKRGLVTDPRNLIFGIQRQVSIETDKDIRSREHIIVLTARVASQIEDNNAVVQLINI
ncbi:MAG: phage major capsid protein [Citrobacter sp.]